MIVDFKEHPIADVQFSGSADYDSVKVIDAFLANVMPWARWARTRGHLKSIVFEPAVVVCTNLMSTKPSPVTIRWTGWCDTADQAMSNNGELIRYAFYQASVRPSHINAWHVDNNRVLHTDFDVEYNTL